MSAMRAATAALIDTGQRQLWAENNILTIIGPPKIAFALTPVEQQNFGHPDLGSQQR
jgi:hypothetical protein